MVRRGGRFAAACLLVAGCVGPSRTAGDYRLKSISTMEQVRSSVEVVRLGLEAAERDRATLPYLSRLFGDAEADAGAAEQALAAVQPPDRASDAVRRRVLDAVGEANEALAEARIAIRRDDVDAAVAVTPSLLDGRASLDALIDELGG